MAQISNVYLMKDLSRLSGHSVHTIKFYLKLGLIKESGRSPKTRFRYFDDSTLAELSQIRAWRKQHKSLAEIKSLLHQTPDNIPDSPGFGVRGSGLESPGQTPQPRTAKV